MEEVRTRKPKAKCRKSSAPQITPRSKKLELPPLVDNETLVYDEQPGCSSSAAVAADTTEGTFFQEAEEIKEDAVEKDVKDEITNEKSFESAVEKASSEETVNSIREVDATLSSITKPNVPDPLRTKKFMERANTIPFSQIFAEGTISMPSSKANIYPSLEAQELVKSNYSNKINTMYDATISGIYPLLEENVKHEKDELLTEHELLGFYYNEIYEGIDDFVEDFIKKEEFPRNSLYEYIERYKIIHEKLDLISIEVTSCEELIKTCALNTWIAEKPVVKKSGKCGDQRSVTGKASYLVAKLNEEKLNELKQLLKRDIKGRLDLSLSLQIEARSLYLQIQWCIIDVNNNFMAENSINSNSPPKLLSSVKDSTCRTNLRGALSDIFHFLRHPSLPTAFTDNLTAWAVELSAVLLKATTSHDQQFMLCNLLRLVSPVNTWGAPLLQPFLLNTFKDDRLIVDHCVAMLGILLSTIRNREVFLQLIANFEHDESSWAIISDDTEEDEVSLVNIREEDLIAFFEQFPIEAIFSKGISHFLLINQLSSLYESVRHNLRTGSKSLSSIEEIVSISDLCPKDNDSSQVKLVVTWHVDFFPLTI